MKQFNTSFTTLMGVWSKTGELTPNPEFKPFVRKKPVKGGQGMVKLTSAQVEQIRYRREVGMESVEALAAEYGICVGYCAQIVTYVARIGLSRGHIGRINSKRD